MFMMTGEGMGMRRQKWQYPQPLTLRILHLPGRNAQRKASRAGRPSSSDFRKPETLHDEESVFLKGGEGQGGGGSVLVALL
ncbi:hypothetical protein CDL15_Pgr020771 [Punica granatum]|uniref:Uncharacterized protein n=1 Tax=Punica granatum TaxID=22663 RepID=A0A218XUU9_PUNGR|nr:hypothetical protein CDL15_Pgr020771 [Punica granatum]